MFLEQQTGVASRDAIAINKGKDEVWCKQIDVVVGWRRIRVIFGCRHGVRVAFLSFGEVDVLKAYFFSAQFFCMPSSFHSLFVYGIYLRNSPNIFVSLVCRVPFTPFLPSLASAGAVYTCALDARVSTRAVRAKPSERSACVQGETCGCG